MDGSTGTEKYWAALEGNILRIAGELDYTVSQDARAKLRELLESGSGHLDVDLGGLDYMDSSGLGVLLDMRKFLTAKGRTFAITQLTAHVAKVFEVTQVGRLFGL